MIAIQGNSFRKNCLIWLSFLTFLTGSTFLAAQPAKAALEYGQAYSDIGTFSNKWGNWCFWMGWDANFSETYDPEGESYAWVIYFAPEAVYLALQSSKSLYSGVNVNAGYKYFYGILDLEIGNRVSTKMLTSEFSSVGLSTNLFSASTAGIGVGAFSMGNLSFALSTGMTFLIEKNSKIVKRGVQIDSGVSVSYDLIAIPLPFSVSLGIDCDVNDDPPELCKFYGFYPIIIWDLEQQASKNPVDLVISELQKITPSSPKSAADVTQKMLMQAVQIMQANTTLRAFMESVAHDSSYDTAISETQQWLQSGDTSNLPESVELPDPVEAQVTMKPIFATTQMAFELGYQRGCIANPTCSTIWADCVIEEYCTPGQECVIEITAEELAALTPGKTAADFEDAWLLIDNPVEQYLVSEEETEEWLQIINGKATYSFSQNTDTPVTLGLRIDPAWAPVENWVHPCSRIIYFAEQPSSVKKVSLAGMILLLLN